MLHPNAHLQSAAVPQAQPSGPLQTVVHATLPCSEHSPRNRRRAQDLAWEWVGAKWPRLVPLARDQGQQQIERNLHDHALRVNTSRDGRVWTLTVMHSEKRSQRIWSTRATVTDTGQADLLDIQTACSDAQHAPMVVAPPKLLGAWVDQLALDDAGFAVLGEARDVTDTAHIEAFCAHVLSERRSLPIIALAHKAQSRHFGVDPGGLALAVRGLAHVACLSPEVAAAVPAILGPGSTVVHGTARIFAPGFHARAQHERHPLLRDKRPVDAEPSADPGSFRRLIVRHVCAMGVRTFAAPRGLAH
ncbi:MAG: hypothetical protein U1F00_16930 [Rhodoferax sp.]